MNRKIIFIVSFLLTTQFLFGQEVFLRGKNAVTIGGGYRTIGTEIYTVNASFEHSFKTIRNVGHFGGGLYADVLMKEDTISPVGTLRGAFHLAFFRTKTVDTYFGGGVAIAPVEKSILHPDVFVGARFKFRKKKPLGIFTEIGYYGANYRVGLCWIW